MQQDSRNPEYGNTSEPALWRRHVALGSIALAIVACDSLVISTHGGVASASRTGTYRAEVVEPSVVPHEFVGGFPMRSSILASNPIVQLQTELPPTVYRVALAVSNGNLLETNKELAAHNILPLSPELLPQIDKALRPSLAQRMAADRVLNDWSSKVISHAVVPRTQGVVGEITKGYSLAQERHVRDGLAEVIDKELAKDVHETSPDSGRRIDVYTAHHHEDWCADWDSYVYHENDLDFNGGTSYNDASPDWKLSRVFPNPTNHPEVISLYQWFKNNAFVFPNDGKRVPGIGDVVIMRVGSGPSDYHTGLVRAVEGSTLIVAEGNSGNALRRKLYTDYGNRDFIIAFGSLFPNR